MRRRILLLVLATTSVALSLLGAILFSLIWMQTVKAGEERAEATAQVAAAALARQVGAHVPVGQANVDELLRDNASLVARLPDGTVLTAGSSPVDTPFAGRATSGGVTVDATIPESYYGGRMAGQVAIFVVVSLLALGIAMLMANLYARRLTRPLEDFAMAADRIARGDLRPTAQRYGVPELDAVAEVLDRGVASFNEVLEAERRATSDASHQLRTPLTALSLRLEEIAASDDLAVVRAEANAALEQVERLSGVIDEVVGANRGVLTAAAERTPVDDIVRGQLSEWSPAYTRAGRGLRATSDTGLVVQVIPGVQSQVLATLLENSLVHGRGVTSVRVRRSAAWVVVEVSDGGPGIPPELDGRVFERNVSGASSSGLGLALARTMSAADGGRLELLSSRPAVFAMFLTLATPAEPEDSPAGTLGAAQPDADPAGAQAEVWIAASSAAPSSSGKTQRR